MELMLITISVIFYYIFVRLISLTQSMHTQHHFTAIIQVNLR